MDADNKSPRALDKGPWLCQVNPNLHINSGPYHMPFPSSLPLLLCSLLPPSGVTHQPLSEVLVKLHSPPPLQTEATAPKPGSQLKNTPCNYSQVCLPVPLWHQSLSLLCSQNQAVFDLTNFRPNQGDAHRNKALRSDYGISLGPWHNSRPTSSISRRICQVSFTWAWHSEKNLYLIFVSSPWHSCSWAPAARPHHKLRSIYSWKPGELHRRTVVFCLGLLSCLPASPPVQGASRPLWLKWSEPWESSRRWGQKDHWEIRSCKALQVIVRILTFILNSVGRHPRFARRSGKTWCVLVEPIWLLWRKSEVS